MDLGLDIDSASDFDIGFDIGLDIDFGSASGFDTDLVTDYYDLAS